VKREKWELPFFHERTKKENLLDLLTQKNKGRRVLREKKKKQRGGEEGERNIFHINGGHRLWGLGGSITEKWKVKAAGQKRFRGK